MHSDLLTVIIISLHNPTNWRTSSNDSSWPNFARLPSLTRQSLSRMIAYLLFIAASVFEILLLVDDKSRSMQPIAWLITEPLPISMIFFGIYTIKYSCLVDDNSIIVTAFRQSQYPLADITSIEVVIGKGARFAVVKFKDGRKVSFPNYMDGFNAIVELLRRKTGLAKPRWEK